MSQVDNRNSSAAKRARTDGSRREDDWTCPSCGNVNFSFRTTCNMRNCTQPRPADHNAKTAVKPMQTPPNYSSSAPYVGVGAPSSMYMGMPPPYGGSLFNGSSMPPYDVPFSGGSAYHYNYGGRISTGSPYRPLHMSGPPPYSGGSMMGNGGMYGMPPLMDRYGLGMPMGPAAAMGPGPSFFVDDKPLKKDSARDNDWTCPKCGNVNFSFRTVCNMRKCNTPKPGSQAAKPDRNSKQKMPEGSWKCEKCNNINYPFRTKCNRQNCGADKPAEGNESPSPAEDENEQVFTEVMCKHPKWNPGMQDNKSFTFPSESRDVESVGSTKRTRTIEEGDYSVPNDPITPKSTGSTMERPIGRDAMKKKRTTKRKEKVTSNNDLFSTELDLLQLERSKTKAVTQNILDILQHNAEKKNKRRASYPQVFRLYIILLLGPFFVIIEY